MNIHRLLGATALVSALAGLPAYAAAQTAPDTTAQTASDDAAASRDLAQAAPAEDTTAQEITVTGSRISNPNGQSTAPITSISAVELQQTGNISVGDVLNNLPALANTFSQQNSTRFLGTSGLSLVDLYGLGTQRTLVLVNGRRHVGADILNNAVSPDVNTFPTDLIDSVDVITGGSSAIYGSDAIAGVVNFKLKQNYEGLVAHGQGGISQKGDAGSYYGSILAGKNFADGRGNVAVNLEYARQNSLYASQRKDLRTANGFIVVDTDPAGTPNGSDGIPDRVFYRDIRPVTISNSGTILFNGRSGTGAGRCGRDSTNAAFDCPYFFRPDGTLVQQTGARAGLSPNGSLIGGNGDTLREGQLVQILPQLDRYSANLIAHFDVSDAFVPFIEAKYVRTNSVGQGSSGPAFFQGSTLDGLYERPRYDNPYLTDQARGVIAQQYALAGLPLTAATRIPIRRNLLDLGVRTEEAKRETYRIVGGVRGTFNGDWKYELSGNYGEFKERTKVLGNLNVQRFLLGMDAVRNVAGQIVCGSQIDATRANLGLTGGPDAGGNPAVLAADIAACQPVNPFGQGNISQAAKNYVLQDTVSVGKITQLDLIGYMSGDTSQFLTLPGGPVQFSVGGEYRRETASFQADPLVASGYTFYNAIANFNPTSFTVKEAYGELRVPLLADITLIKELTLSGAGRVSDYKGAAGTNYTYNAGVDYSPVADLRFRAQYARAVRAPNLQDLYSPLGQNFAPGFVDPCAARQIGTGSSTRAANCAAAGIPTTGAGAYDYIYQSSLEIQSGGNPTLKVEKSDSYTYGGVYQPSYVPGLTLSVDYYNIQVNDVITAPSAQAIANGCYDAASLDNQFCGLFQRVAAGATGPGGEEAYRIIEGSLQQTTLNYAKLKVRGINTDLSYTRRFGENKNVSAHFIWTHALQNDSFLNPTDPNRANRLLGEAGQPKDAFNVSLNASAGTLYVGYQFRYLSRMNLNTYEDVNSLQGRPPENADYADILYYKSVTYHDLRLGVNVEGGSNFYFGVDNLTNTRPPLSSTGIGAGTGIYEPVGRRFYAGFTAKF